METRPFLSAVSSFFLIFFFSLPVLAATSPETEVGVEEERLHRPKKLEVPEKPPAEVELPPEEPLPADLPSQVQIPVKELAVEGATLIPDEELAALTGSLIGRSVTFGELRQSARKITQWYRSHGFVTSRAFIPAQSVEEGVVRIRVIEGKVGEIRIEGARYFSDEILAAQIKVRSGEILRLKDLQASLKRLNAHPDRKVKGVMVKGKRPETTDLVLQVTDQFPFHASTSVDTLGTKATGWIRQSITLAHGNLTGVDDQVTLRGIVSEFGGLKGGSISYLRPISPKGITATFDVSGIRSDVGGDFKNLHARGEAISVSPGLLVPLYQDSKWDLEGVAGFDLKRIRTRLDEVVRSKDDLRVVRFGTNLLEKDSHGQSLLIQELRVGVPSVLGGSHGEDISASRVRAGGSFVRWLVSGIRVQAGPKNISLLARASAQVTTDRLVPAEQFRLGGFDTVRGYPEGEYLADAGFQATLELRAPLATVLPPLADSSGFGGRLGKSLLLAVFWDFAEGFVRDPAAFEDADARLSGVGFGFRLRPTEESLLQADFGWPLGDSDAEKDRPRLHLICRIGF